MRDDVDCLVFSEQLEALTREALPPEAAACLRSHAAGCTTCATQLRIHEHLLGPSLEELEARVPEPMLETVYRGVMAELERREATAAGKKRGARRSHGSPVASRWLVPLLAAASLALLFASSLLYTRWREAEARGESLARQLATGPTMAVSAQAAPISTRIGGRSTRFRLLSGSGDLTVGALRSRLEELPSDALLLSPAEAAAWAERLPPWAPVPLRRAAAEIREAGQNDGGVRAGELLRILDALSVDPAQRVPARRVLAWLD